MDASQPHRHIPAEVGTSGRAPGQAGAVIDIETAVLAKNDHLAAHNRAWLAERRILALNLMSSPDPARPPCCTGPLSRSPPGATSR